MTDCALIRQEMKTLYDFSDDEISKYDSLILCAADWVKALLRQEKDENNVLIVHLCAAKAYYQISLIKNEGVSSFSAGEVSFSVNHNSAEDAERVFKAAAADCRDLLVNSSFAFEAV